MEAFIVNRLVTINNPLDENDYQFRTFLQYSTNNQVKIHLSITVIYLKDH